MFKYGDDHLTCSIAIKIAKGEIKGYLSKEAIERINRSAQIVNEIAVSDKTVYGINTGFGPLCNTRISAEDTKELQRKLLISHSVGVGNAIDPEISKIMMILKVHALAKGFSGVTFEVLERIILMIENNWIPFVPEQGSVGASGDLAPLSHLFLPLIGYGQLFVNGTYKDTESVLNEHDLASIDLSAKDGLGLINGTQFIAAHAVKIVDQLHKSLSHADINAALMIEGLMGSQAPFKKELHELRAFKGNQYAAARVFAMLEDSEILNAHANCEKVQDPYSLRCVPQVHGSSRNAWLHLKESVEIEINSVTDNPIIFSQDLTISGGNFHGQPLALPIDYACLAAAELGNISDRRTYLSLEGKYDDTPRLLLKETGLNSGFMILQYT
ncbi:MAG: aromatic amino acid ammonia-lyase, partial [Bacteroidota bacterium]